MRRVVLIQGAHDALEQMHPLRLLRLRQAVAGVEGLQLDAAVQPFLHKLRICAHIRSTRCVIGKTHPVECTRQAALSLLLHLWAGIAGRPASSHAPTSVLLLLRHCWKLHMDIGIVWQLCEEHGRYTRGF